MFGDEKFSTKRWRRHLVLNEGIEVDDFQYGREGQRNRPPGRYPLRLWNRLRHPNADNGRQATGVGPHATTDMLPSSTERIAVGDCEAVRNASPNTSGMRPRTSPARLEHALLTCPMELTESGTTVGRPSSAPSRSAMHNSPLAEVHPGLDMKESYSTADNSARVDASGLSEHGYEALLRALQPCPQQPEHSDLSCATQRDRRDEKEALISVPNDATTTEPFPLLHTEGSVKHKKDISPRRSGDRPRNEIHENLTVSRLECSAAVPRSISTLADGQDNDIDAEMPRIEEAQTARDAGPIVGGFRGNLRGIKEKLSRTFRRSLN